VDNPLNPKERLFEMLHRDRERRGELDLERQKAEIRAQSHALVWKGPPAELVSTITRWYKSGWIEAESIQDALERASIHFVDSQGNAVTHPPIAAIQLPPADSSASNPREAFVLPLLDNKGWSILEWANEARVAYHTAADYLSGATKPYRSSRAKLAKALGLTANQLPQ